MIAAPGPGSRGEPDGMSRGGDSGAGVAGGGGALGELVSSSWLQSIAST